MDPSAQKMETKIPEWSEAKEIQQNNKSLSELLKNLKILEDNNPNHSSIEERKTLSENNATKIQELKLDFKKNILNNPDFLKPDMPGYEQKNYKEKHEQYLKDIENGIIGSNNPPTLEEYTKFLKEQEKINESPTRDELINEFKAITKKIDNNLKTLWTFKTNQILDEDYYKLINENSKLKKKQIELNRKIEK